MSLRTTVLADGTKKIERGSEEAGWAEVMVIGANDVYGEFVRAGDDIEAAPHPTSDGILLKIAGTTFGLPREQAELAAVAIAATLKRVKERDHGAPGS